MLILALLACHHVVEAPPDVDDVFHGLWMGYVGADADVAGVLDEATPLLNLDGDPDPPDGTLTDLSADEIGFLDLSDRDPADAAGFFLAGTIACDLDALTDVVVATNQDELYPDAYDTYSRAYTSDRDAWDSGASDSLTWETDYTTTLLGATYEEVLDGGVRRVDDPDRGTVLMARTVMPEPAVFEEGSNKTFDQDYQIEAYWQRGDVVVHLYGIWRQIDMGSGLDQDNAEVVRITVNNLHDWDAQTEKDCQGS